MLYLILSVIFYTIAIMLIAFASRITNSTLVTAIVNSVSVVIPISVVFLTQNKKLFDNKLGIFFAIGGGIAIALYTLAFSKSLQVNKVALVAPAVFGGAMFLSAILSYVIFKEKLSPLHSAGLAIVGVGLLIIIYSATSSK